MDDAYQSMKMVIEFQMKSSNLTTLLTSQNILFPSLRTILSYHFFMSVLAQLLKHIYRHFF